MKIGVFGTGVVGQTIAAKLAGLGHDVMIGTRDVQGTLAKTAKDGFGRPPFKDWQRENPAVKLGTHAQAASHGELLVNATNGQGSLDALKAANIADLNGKVLMDIANPLDFSKGMPPSLFVSNTDSLGETIQRAFPALNVVKTLNTMNAYLMVAPGLLPEPTNVFLSGNDAAAKDQVKEVLRSFGWADADMIDLGDLTTARGTEQLLPIWVRLYGALQNPLFNFRIVQGKA
jgi:8-hydroxy-5-deazaflavin:NADPH oxidoreductase